MRVAVFVALWFAAVVFALWKGGAPERYGAATLAFLTIGIVPLRAAFPLSYVRVDPAILMIDAIAAVAFIAIAIRANRNWPFWTCSAQLIALIAHLARAVDWQAAPIAYGIMTRGPAYIQCAALLAGTWLHTRRISRSGSYPSWVTYSP